MFRVDSSFSIESALGAGAYGEVFLANPLFEEGFDVLKIPKGLMHPAVDMYRRSVGLRRPANRDMRLCKRMIEKEGAVLGLIQGHPSIPILRTYTTPTLLFMEFQADDTLADFIEENKGRALREGHLDLLEYTASCVSIAKEVCAGLEYMASKGIMLHGDVKPSNIILAMDCRGISVQLIDYGFAFAHPDLAFTRSGIDFTDNEYTAPEIRDLRVPEPHANSDVFSLGMLLYQALSPAAELMDTKFLLLPGVFDEYISIGVGERLDACIAPMVLKDSKRRFSLRQAGDALGELEGFLRLKCGQ